jgi:nitrogen fixation protein FixH
MADSGTKWPFIIVGLLVVSAGANLAFVAVATSDPAFAVEADYYQKAVQFDQIQAAQAKSDALGWTTSMQADHQGLTVTLLDKAGAPVSGAKVQVIAFHNARAGDTVGGALTSGPAGTYSLKQDFLRKGIWEYRLRADRGGDHFMTKVRKELQ